MNNLSAQLEDKLRLLAAYAFPAGLRPTLYFGEINLQNSNLVFIAESESSSKVFSLELSKLSFKLRSFGQVLQLSQGDSVYNVFFTDGLEDV